MRRYQSEALHIRWDTVIHLPSQKYSNRKRVFLPVSTEKKIARSSVRFFKYNKPETKPCDHAHPQYVF